MIENTGPCNCAFSLNEAIWTCYISNESRISQLLSGIIYIIIYKEDLNICLKSMQILISLPTFFNADNVSLINIVNRILKLSVANNRGNSDFQNFTKWYPTFHVIKIK